MNTDCRSQAWSRGLEIILILISEVEPRGGKHTCGDRHDNAHALRFEIGLLGA